MKKPLITLTSDFGVQSQGVGIMEAVAFSIAPDSRVIHLMHGLPDFDILAAARTLETVKFLPVGYHVCVVDPGVGTHRKGLLLQTKRGDVLVGPDNGVLLPATRFLGNGYKAYEITNPKYMRHPVSPIFHGRDVFVPAAAHLSLGVEAKEFGPELDPRDLVKAPYEEATVKGNQIEAMIIRVNKFGSLHLNVTNELWDSFSVELGKHVQFECGKNKIEMPFLKTFGEIEKDKPLIVKDDYERIEVALNMASFADKFGVKAGDLCTIRKK